MTCGPGDCGRIIYPVAGTYPMTWPAAHALTASVEAWWAPSVPVQWEQLTAITSNRSEVSLGTNAVGMIACVVYGCRHRGCSRRRSRCSCRQGCCRRLPGRRRRVCRRSCRTQNRRRARGRTRRACRRSSGSACSSASLPHPAACSRGSPTNTFPAAVRRHWPVPRRPACRRLIRRRRTQRRKRG